MRVLDLALKDLTQLVRDWKAAVFLVIMPIAFTLFFGFIFGNVGEEEDPRLPVGFLDRDGGGVLSLHLLDMLTASDAIRPVVLGDESQERAERRVSDQELAAAVVVPAGYSERALAGEPLAVTVIVDTSTTAGLTAQSGIQAAVTRLQGAVEAARLGAAAVRARGGRVDEAFLTEALDAAIAAWQQPPVTVSATRSRAIETSEEETEVERIFGSNPYAHSSPAMMVQFAIAGLMGAGTVMVLERKSFCLRRLLTTAILRAEIILGHFLAMFVMTFLQLALLTGFGQLLLGLDYLRQPLATLMLMVAIALWAAALGLLVGTLAKTEDQVIIFSLIPMFVFAGLGGAWMPLELTGKTFQTIGHFLPVAWMMDGLKDILIRGLGVEAVLLPVRVILAYAVAFFALAAWRFRFE